MKETGYTSLNQKSVPSWTREKRCLDTDLVCFSHLRWDFVFQRPQHLMTRFARYRRVFYIEEPIFDDTPVPYTQVSPRKDRLQIITPHLPREREQSDSIALQESLLRRLFAQLSIQDYTLWYYTPMALKVSRFLEPEHVIYDCMDELSAFKGASPELLSLEKELFLRADYVFTGGYSLYEAKSTKHPRVYAFPSSIDFEHFAQARQKDADPFDQASIASPRLGFYGVIDERTDIDLLTFLARERPDWQIVLIGPVVKIDPESLPNLPNIHYLGAKKYQDLPKYIAHWDVAILPFALNEATRFISPTKTPEYLAAGRPVVSTAVKDVIRPYGESGFVRIGRDADDFLQQCELSIGRGSPPGWLANVDEFLKRSSWNKTWSGMAQIEAQGLFVKQLVN